MTDRDKFWHHIYEGLPPESRDAVDEAFRAARESLKENFMLTEGDDRAEALVAALTRYVVECGNNEPED